MGIHHTEDSWESTALKTYWYTPHRRLMNFSHTVDSWAASKRQQMQVHLSKYSMQTWRISQWRFAKKKCSW